MKILIVEDEPKTLAYLHKGLTASGFAVDVAADGVDGLFFATTGDHDLVVLDIALPQVDGWTIVTALRSVGKPTPVLILTACGSVEDRVKGLELGADDFLVKPFAFSELLARVRCIMRRGPDMHTEIIQVADLEVDVARQRVSRGGKYIDLTAKEFKLLLLLVRRTGEILSRTLISDLVWDMDFDCNTNVVDVAIRRLRSKVDDHYDRKLIHTARGRGYVLEPR